MAEKLADFPPEAARAALERLLASADFGATNRIRRFLCYVVEETLAGRADRIKAYTIATSVFGRDESFDPQVDSIVRIEAGRLRRALERYYLTSGQHERMQLRIPVGCYVPVLVDRHLDGPPASPAVANYASHRPSSGGPAILVEPFACEGENSSHPNFAAGLTQSLVVRLTRFTSIRVFFTGERRDDAPDPGGAGMSPDYVLRGSVSLSQDRAGVEVVLFKAQTGQTLWADSFESSFDVTERFAMKDHIAGRVAQVIAQPFGIIFADTAREDEGAAPSKQSSYGAIRQFYRYWTTFDRDMIGPVRDALERAVQSDPNYGEALACLSLVYSNAFRFGHCIGPVDFDLRERALELADRAIQLAPNSSWSHYARSVALWFVNDVDGGIQALETGRTLNPNDSTLLAELGQRYAFLMQWDKAVPLLEQAYQRNPAQPGGYRIGLFLHHLAHRRFEKALHEARRVVAPHVLYGHVAVAAAAGELGRSAEATEAVRRILALDPRYGDRVVADLRSRNVHETLIGLILDGLRKGGLRGDDMDAPPVLAQLR